MINEEFKKLCEENNPPIPLEKGFVFAIFWRFKDEVKNLEQYFLDRGILEYDEFQPLQIALCKTNPETLKPELKVDLFGGVSSDEFSNFLVELSFVGISGKGHVNNELEYSIFDSSLKVDKDAYKLAKTALGEYFSPLKCVDVISNYYRTTKFAKKFANYVGSSAFLMDYKSYQDIDNGRLLNKS